MKTMGELWAKCDCPDRVAACGIHYLDPNSTEGRFVYPHEADRAAEAKRLTTAESAATYWMMVTDALLRDTEEDAEHAITARTFATLPHYDGDTQ